MRRAATLIVSASVAGCWLSISTDDFSGGGSAADAPDAANDGSVVGDASAEADASSTDAPADAPTSDPNLVGAWAFDEGTGFVAHDSTSFHNDATLINTTFTTGHSGSALACDGLNGHAEAAHTKSFEVAETFTVAAWLKLDVVAWDQRWFANGYSFGLKLNTRSPQLELSNRYAVAAYQMPVNEWHHLAVTFDRGKVVWYADGGAVDLQTTTFVGGETAPLDTSSLKIGTKADDTDPSKGAIDDVRFYRRVLTAPEIAQLAR